MGRIIAIDYGSKRCGIAVSDPAKVISSPLEMVASHELMLFLEGYFSSEGVELLVVGKPLKNDGSPSDSFILVERFVAAFKKRFPQIPVEWEDERYTSVMAQQAMIDGGMKKSDRRKKGNLDKISASIILRAYLDRVGGGTLGSV